MENLREIRVEELKGAVVQIKAASLALRGLEAVLQSVADGVREAFAVKGYQDYLQTVRRFGKELANELLVLQMAFGKMKVAIAQAVSPIAQVFVPLINQAIFAVIRFAGYVRQLLTALFSGLGLISGTQAAADAQWDLASATTAAGSAAKRSLMAFDQLNRLNGSSGGGSGGISFGQPEPLKIAPGIQKLVDKILKLLEPLKNIDFEPMKKAFATLWEALEKLFISLAPVLEWLWYEILVPFITWLAEEFVPAFIDGLAAAVELAATSLGPLLEGLQQLWDTLEPMVEYIGTAVIDILNGLADKFRATSESIENDGSQITGVFQNVGTWATNLWQIVKPVLDLLRGGFSQTFSEAGTAAANGTGSVQGSLQNLSTYLSGGFSSSWQGGWTGVKNTLKNVVNGIISLINNLLCSVTSGLNKVVGAANSLAFTVPSWVPGIGGKKFGLNLSYLTAPSIPYLAQGAVLPANKPFLAMVGDQRHGTNVEAPLATIQEAVAQVMADATDANLQGHAQTVAVLQRILEAVLGISIGDDTIAAAVQRHDHRMALMRGY